MLFVAGLPPVSSKLVKRTEEGKLIEMTEVLYKRLAAYTLNDNHTRASKPKIKYVTNIIDWVQALVCMLLSFHKTTPEGTRSHWISSLDY